MENTRRIVATNVKKLRKGRFTQSQLADASGVSTILINRIESGKHAPQLANVEAIAGALGVPTARLLHDTELEMDPVEMLEKLTKYIHAHRALKHVPNSVLEKLAQVKKWNENHVRTVLAVLDGILHPDAYDTASAGAPRGEPRKPSTDQTD